MSRYLFPFLFLPPSFSRPSTALTLPPSAPHSVFAGHVSIVVQLFLNILLGVPFGAVFLLTSRCQLSPVMYFLSGPSMPRLSQAKEDPLLSLTTLHSPLFSISVVRFLHGFRTSLKVCAPS